MALLYWNESQVAFDKDYDTEHCNQHCFLSVCLLLHCFRPVCNGVPDLLCYVIASLIARFIGPTWGPYGAHLGPTGPRWAPCWPHELWYLGYHAQKFFYWSLHFHFLSEDWCPTLSGCQLQACVLSPSFCIAQCKWGWVRKAPSRHNSVYSWNMHVTILPCYHRYSLIYRPQAYVTTSDCFCYPFNVCFIRSNLPWHILCYCLTCHVHWTSHVHSIYQSPYFCLQCVPWCPPLSRCQLQACVLSQPFCLAQCKWG